MEIIKLATPTLNLIRQNRTALATAAGLLAFGGAALLLPRAAADYRAWRALGENGLPLNLFGYVFQSLARPFARSDTRVPEPYDNAALARGKRYGPLSQRSFFPGSIPRRRGDRPVVPDYAGPHRQTTQGASQDIRDKQEAFLHALAAANPSLIQVKPSNLEGPLFNSVWIREGIVDRRPELRNLNGEFAHPHGEGSTHMVLTLVDSAAAIEAGWAERHRMSGVGIIMPWNFIMIYAPRDEEEFGVWMMFMYASAKYVLGGKTKVTMP
ncbi:hypothetical protein F5Y04DRAFT_261340 [Hypomontagnella monticulosa]|nr:hypothetical protein F5Y04DRAFT_261340 [Hypomontagnella monticulosa]